MSVVDEDGRRCVGVNGGDPLKKANANFKAYDSRMLSTSYCCLPAVPAGQGKPRMSSDHYLLTVNNEAGRQTTTSGKLSAVGKQRQEIYLTYYPFWSSDVHFS